MTIYKPRIAIGTTAVVIIGIIVIAVAAAVAIGFASTRSGASTSTVQTPVTVTASAIEVNGPAATNATYKIGDELKLSVTVTSGTSPISVHEVYNGITYPEHAWNVNATHYNYVIDSGPADTTDLGAHTIYAVVTFEDGSTVQSNNVTWTVTQ